MTEKSDGIDLSRRKVLGGLTALGAASAATGAGTFALFSDTESSTGNTISAGTLDLTPGGVSGFSINVGPIAPGQSAGSSSVSLQNSGTLSADHLEFDASLTGDGGEASEPNDNGLDGQKGNAAFAKRVFVNNLTYGGTPVNWGGAAFATLVDHPGSVVFNDMTLDRVSDPGNKGHGTVLRMSGTGYGISMRSVPSTSLSSISNGTVTAEWYGGANNVDSAPDEIYAVIKDSGGTRHLVYHVANYDSNNNDDDGQTWRTIDLGTEMGLTTDTDYYNPNFNWPEIAPNNNNTYPDPDHGGLTGDATNDDQANGSFSGSATLEAIGFGAGNYGSQVQKEVYYDNLTVGSKTLEFRPLTLYDVAKRGVADKLAAPTSSGKTFSLDMTFDPTAGNAYQAEGVTAKFEFGLAQQSGQDVL